MKAGLEVAYMPCPLSLPRPSNEGRLFSGLIYRATHGRRRHATATAGIDARVYAESHSLPALPLYLRLSHFLEARGRWR